MKLLIINALSARQGGGETNVTNLLIQLSSENIKILVLTNSENHDKFKLLRSPKIKYFNSKWASKSLVHRLFWELFFIKRLIVKFNASVYYNPGGTLLSRTPADCTGITTVQNMLPFSVAERKRYPLTNFLRYKFFFLKYIYLHSYKNANKIIFPSLFSYNSVTKYINLEKCTYTIIPNGVNEIFFDDEFCKREPNILKKENYYLYVSTFDYYKAQLEIVSEWAKLINKGLNLTLILIGHSSNDYKKKVAELIKMLKLDQFVILLNPVSHTDLPSIYAKSRALIFASSCECGPNILTEMMTSRKLIFCSNFEPMPEVGLDSLVYFNPYTINDLSNKIILAENEDRVLNSDLANKAYEYAQCYNASISTSLIVNFILGK